MPRVFRCFCLGWLLIITPVPAQAHWEWLKWLMGGCPNGQQQPQQQHLLEEGEESDTEEFPDDDDDDDDVIIQPETALLVIPSQEDIYNAQAWLSTLSPPLQDLFRDEGIDAQLLQVLVSDRQSICQSINQLMRELAFFRTDAQLQHHHGLRALLDFGAVTGGAVNRFGGLSGLHHVLTEAGASETEAMAISWIVTVGAFGSSNLLSLTGTQNVEYEGIHNYREVVAAFFAWSAGLIDSAMSFYAFNELFDSLLAGAVTVPFMLGGLVPVLNYSLLSMMYSSHGEDPKKLRYLQKSIRVFARLLRTMRDGNVSMASGYAWRLEIYRILLGLQNPSRLLKLLDAFCIHGRYAYTKNTLRYLRQENLLENLDPEECVFDRLYAQCESQKNTTGAVVTQRVLMLVAIGPALAYVYGDSTSAAALLEKLLNTHLECGHLAETFGFWVFQGGMLVAMSGKMMAAAKNGVDNIKVLCRWLKSWCDPELAEQMKLSCCDYALVVFGVGLAGVYGTNSGATVAGNIMNNDCLGGQNLLALGIISGLSVIGGGGFNAGTGIKLKELKHSAKSFKNAIKSFGASAKQLFGDSQQGSHQDAEALSNLIKENILAPLPENQQKLREWLAGQGFTPMDIESIEEDLLPKDVRCFEPDESCSLEASLSHEEPKYGATSTSGNPFAEQVSTADAPEVQAESMEQEISNWLYENEFSANLAPLMTPGDEQYLRMLRWLRDYLNQISFKINHHHLNINRVISGEQALLQVLIGAYGLETTTEALRHRLIEQIMGLLDVREALSDREKRLRGMIGARGCERLRRLLRHLLDGNINDPQLLLQIFALLENQNLAFIQPHHETHDLTMNFIESEAPGVVHEQVDNMSTDIIIIDNGMGGWAWGHHIPDTGFPPPVTQSLTAGDNQENSTASNNEAIVTMPLNLGGFIGCSSQPTENEL